MLDKKEILYLKIVESHMGENPILDVGGFEGNWTDQLISIGIKNNILIIEPNPDNVKKLESKYMDMHNISIINKGASDKNQILTYYSLDNQDNGVREMSGFVLREIYSNYNYNKIEVEVIRIDDIINSEIEFLKIDTEGFEFNVISGISKLLDKKLIKFIQFEYGGTYVDQGIKLNDIIDYLKEFGYQTYDIDINGNLIELSHFTDDYIYNNLLSTYIKL